jgi:hypothetical protein
MLKTVPLFTRSCQALRFHLVTLSNNFALAPCRFQTRAPIQITVKLNMTAVL